MVAKKGQEKGIQLVFVVFVLLIITITILMIFFKTVRVPKMKCDPAKDVQMAVTSCQDACDAIGDLGGQASLNSAIEFCSKTVSIDYNCDKLTKGEKMSYGTFTSCEDKVPCFELISCQGYDGNKCHDLLKNRAPAKYNQIAYKDYTADCGLNATDPSNWVYKYNFTK